MADLRPFFSYFGGKWSLAPLYPKPEHDLIIEPFAGSAGYASRYSDRDVILVEHAPHVAHMWRWLIAASVDEVMALPLDVNATDGLADAPRELIAFWCARGRTRGARTAKSSWMTDGRWPTSFWGESIRERIAKQVTKIRHWKVIEGDYTSAPDARATWFVDPPYIGSRHYLARVDDYAALGYWCRARHGLVVACEQNDAAWLPFKPFRQAKSLTHRSYQEVVLHPTHGNIRADRAQPVA